MTLRHERYNALRNVRELLYELCKPGTKFTKKQLRSMVRSCLKHYPSSYDVIMMPDSIEDTKKFMKLKKLLDGIRKD